MVDGNGPFTLFVDEREKGPQRAAVMEAFPEAVVKTLDVADYIVGSVGIEFKSMKDLEFDAGHDLWQKLANLESFPYRFLVVMGTYDRWRESDPRLRYNRKEWEAAKARLDGALMSVLFNRQVSLVMVEDADEFVQFLKKVIKRLSREERAFERPVETRKPAGRALSEVQSDMICAIDGIGRSKARALAERFINPRGIAEATVEEIGELPGFGKARAETVHRAFNGREE
jgi:ERCC4-type nuclease